MNPKPNKEPSSIEEIRKTFSVYERRQLSIYQMGGLRNRFETIDQLKESLKAELYQLEWDFEQKRIEAEKEEQRKRELEEKRKREVEQQADKIDDDWYIQYPDMTWCLRPFQVKAAHQMWDILFEKDKHGLALNSGVGTGKTPMSLYLIKRAEMTGVYTGKTIAPWPYLIVTKASVVEQFKRVAKYGFNLDIVNRVMITNYDQLRSTFGERFIKEETIVKDGEEEITFKWMNWVHPVFFIWDESHSLKNEQSSQSKIGQAVNDINSPMCPVKQIEMSATLWTRISDMKHFACSIKEDINVLAERVNESWRK